MNAICDNQYTLRSPPYFPCVLSYRILEMILLPSCELMKSTMLHLLPQVSLTTIAFQWLLGEVMIQHRTRTLSTNSFASLASLTVRCNSLTMLDLWIDLEEFAWNGRFSLIFSTILSFSLKSIGWTWLKMIEFCIFNKFQ